MRQFKWPLQVNYVTQALDIAHNGVLYISFYAEYVNCCHFGLFFVSVCENTPIRRVIFTKMAMSILMHEHINSTILAKVGNAGTKCVLNMIYQETIHIV